MSKGTFFISYNSADLETAQAVASALKAAGASVRFDQWEVALGANVALWIGEALEASDRMVAIVSPDYLKPEAKYSAVERAATLWDDIDGKKTALVPLVIRPCEIPKLLKPLARYDLAKGSLDDFIDKLLNGPKMGGVVPPPVAADPINLPPGRRAVGREGDLAHIETLLASGQKVSVVNSGAVVQGQGGVGKSTLAREYAITRAEHYQGVLWCNAALRSSLVDDLLRLIPLFPLANPPASPEETARAVLEALRASGQRWLFIYDNVVNRAEFHGLIPPGDLILTTRAGGDWPGFACHRTEVLDYSTNTAPAVRLLAQVAQRDDDAPGARGLAEDLGGLPLGLVVMGSLIRNFGGTFTQWRGRLAEAIELSPQNDSYPHSILSAVRLSYDRLPQDAKLIADLCAWWAAEGLGPELLTEAPKGWLWQHEAVREAITPDVDTLAQSPARVRAGFHDLMQSGLVTGESGCFAMHRLTATALRMAQGGQPMARPAAALLAAVFQQDVIASANWPQCKRLTPHVRAMVDTGAAPPIAAMSFLCNQSAIYLDGIGDQTGFLAMAQAGFDLTKQIYPDSYHDYAVGLATLGVAYGKAGELERAEKILAQVVALDKAHRPVSSDLAEHYDLHAGALLHLARAGRRDLLDRAAERYSQALRLHRQVSGEESYDVAVALNNLGAVRREQGRGEDAAKLYQKALDIWRAVLPPGDSRLAYGAMNIGSSWLEAGRADLAEPLLQEAVTIWHDALEGRTDHPELRNAADWLIACLLVRARAAENAGLRNTQARTLCRDFGFDFAQRQEQAQNYPYTPPAR